MIDKHEKTFVLIDGYTLAKETYFLYCRGQMLLSGELRFNYGEWFDGDFLRLFRVEQGKS